MKFEEGLHEATVDESLREKPIRGLLDIPRAIRDLCKHEYTSMDGKKHPDRRSTNRINSGAADILERFAGVRERLKRILATPRQEPTAESPHNYHIFSPDTADFFHKLGVELGSEGFATMTRTSANSPTLELLPSKRHLSPETPMPKIADTGYIVIDEMIQI
ncbi:MAG: hypothetical protein WCT36_01765 [Candidatus Gracilibacteria bacterium]